MKNETRRIVITVTKSSVLPVEVDFGTCVNHYRDLDCAMTDIKLFSDRDKERK